MARQTKAERDARAQRALYGLFTANRGFFDRENGRGASDRVIADKITRYGQKPDNELDRKIVQRASDSAQPSGGIPSNSPS